MPATVVTRPGTLGAVSNAGLPTDTLHSGSAGLKIVNGQYFYWSVPFTGYLLSTDPHEQVRTIQALRNGRADGISRSFFASGQKRDERSYRSGKSYGKHMGWWASGKSAFDYRYIYDRLEGDLRKWYESGAPFLHLHYCNDSEDGPQQGWRENGKLFLNYTAKDGRRYGLQKAALCYTLAKEKTKVQ